ncbi:RNA-directed DNA polymerase, eukaryota [Tanacetum coccineum]|uniref:RNA-directed DNA polymerase, eukaryota n=1 Tax=Tanacetum coccineum TaxID=301880 RepID=A0ABQ4YNB9_9ASTR
MGIFRTKEDDVAKISTSIYVSNFPEVFSAKDLFHACKKYGHVIDSFIPFKKSKDGKRFGFCSISLMCLNMERLVFVLRAKEIPGWVPEFADEFDDDDESEEGSKGDTANSHGAFNFDDADDVDKVPETELDNIGRSVNDVTSPRIVEKEHNEQERINNYNGSKDEMSGSVCSGIFKKPVAPQSGGSILCVLEELVKVGQAMGYNMKGLAQKAKRDWVKELCLKNKVNFLALQETKMENMNLWCVKACWGNYTFDYAHSDSVGNSGGILCIWDPNSFQKDNVTVSDFFIIIRGTWLKSGVKILMVAVYAPHDLRDKKILWDYLEYIINRWDGEVLIMGDFNEVRRKTERFGSVFNVQGADMFNTFIANAGLEEIPLGGYFNHWTELDGFNKFVIDTWNSAPVETNAMRNVMQKFKFLKGKIREWLKIYKSKNGGSGILKEELNRIDADIDKGLASDIIINRRMEVIKSIQYLDKIHVMDLAQKAKLNGRLRGMRTLDTFMGS